MKHNKIITSEIMKGAVEQLFNHESVYNNKCSSHSQLERWIIQDMEKRSPRNTVGALTDALMSMRRIKLNIDIDCDIEEMQERYKAHDMHNFDTGGGCTAFRKETSDGAYYFLVTTDEGADIPCNLDVPVCIGMYDATNDMFIWSEKFVDSHEMFDNGLIEYLISR